MRICKRLLRQNRSYLNRIIWIDAAEDWVSLDNHKSVLVRLDWDNKLITEDWRVPDKKVKRSASHTMQQ